MIAGVGNSRKLKLLLPVSVRVAILTDGRKLNRFDLAIEDYTRSLALQPGNVKTLNNRCAHLSQVWPRVQSSMAAPEFAP